MPELPEVETVRRGLEPAMSGARFVDAVARRPDLRFPFPERFVERLKGRTVTGLGRRAKYLLADLDDGEVLVMHLGMSGSFRVSGGDDAETPGGFHHDRSRIAAHDHVVFTMSGGETITYNDPRRFGFMALVPRADLDAHRFFKDLGIEPVGNRLDAAYIDAAFRGRIMSLKAALLDQRIIAGLGNIYVCEALHRAGLSPRRGAGSISTKRGGPGVSAVRLTDAIRAVIAEAIEAGGSSLRDYSQADGSLGYFQHRFRVYDREGADCPAPECTGTIARIVQSGRSTFYCPRCQR